MREVVTTSLRLHLPPARDLRARFFRALAGELASVQYSAAVVVESSTCKVVPDLWASPAEVVRPLLAASVFEGVRTSLPASSYERVPASRSEWQVAWAVPPVSSPAPPAAPSTLWDVPGRLALLGPTGRLELQTFWMSGRSDGRLWIARRARFVDRCGDELERRGAAVAAFVATEWSRTTGVLCRARPLHRCGVDWTTASPRSLARRDWLAVPPLIAQWTGEPTLPGESAAPVEETGHTLVLGSTGAGKTTYLADRASRAIRAGSSVVVVDLHGDLSGAIVDRLTPVERERVLAVDAGDRPVVGVAALRGTDSRSAAQFVAAVKRLTPDGGDVYWGFRLERIFDAFVRLVQESGGDLGDLYALLTDADRREAARLATHVPELARFLDELGPVVRRNPEFLWSAAARLAKVVLVPELAELLAPRDSGVPVEEMLEAGRSLLIRIPLSTLGPEAASFAGSLVAARVYLSLTSRSDLGPPCPPVLVVLDEVQGLSSRLVSEMLAEGRKFGVRCLIASQYPERLAPELRLAAAGVSRGAIVFRVPRASAATVGSWLGLSRIEAEELLPELPTGLGITRAEGTGALRSVHADPTCPWASVGGWHVLVDSTRRAFPPSPAPEPGSRDMATERLLLAVLAGEERGAPTRSDQWVEEAAALPGEAVDAALLDDRRGSLERSRLVSADDGAIRLTPAGERQLGLRASTGASRESAEHRALLLRAFRLFARHGHRLEIVRQGRYDTTLPDAIYRQLSDPGQVRSPRELAGAVDSARLGWAWRFFGGLDVHVEAEVSGALRAARIRHGWDKARRRGAYALFLVGDPARAARVRRVLREIGVRIDRAQVWTLRDSGSAGPMTSLDGKPAESSRPP